MCIQMNMSRHGNMCYSVHCLRNSLAGIYSILVFLRFPNVEWALKSLGIIYLSYVQFRASIVPSGKNINLEEILSYWCEDIFEVSSGLSSISQ